ncbi:MAG: hypothetical protein HGB17_17675, partial [Syntrophobacteraceae bacterium]|nr:hypothetical protein [Syntrophobacteraceae bacterium]
QTVDQVNHLPFTLQSEKRCDTIGFQTRKEIIKSLGGILLQELTTVTEQVFFLERIPHRNIIDAEDAGNQLIQNFRFWKGHATPLILRKRRE